MNMIGSLVGHLKGFYSGINGATLTGAIDVIVVEQPDGTYKCSPFHVRFGKLGVLRSKEKVVDMEINGEPVPVRMKLGDSGEAFFVEEVENEEDLEDSNLATSPLPSSPRTSREADELKDVVINKETLPDIIQDNSNDSETSRADEKPMGSIGKKRKKRRRRKDNGSKSDIPVVSTISEALEKDLSIETETMFQMDEDYSHNRQNVKIEMDEPTTSRSFHTREFFSDTEVDHTSSPNHSRPPSPVQSDYEYETQKTTDVNDDEVNKWRWGELPSTTNSPAATPVSLPPCTRGSDLPLSDSKNATFTESGKYREAEAVQKSMLGSVLSFMKGKKGIDAKETEGRGIYLEDLNTENLDQETVNKYILNSSFSSEFLESGKHRLEKDEDKESGKGNSLPQSPDPGSSPKSSHLSIHMPSSSKPNKPKPVFEGISSCGTAHNLFDQCMITYDQLIENPDIMSEPSQSDLMVKIDGKILPWAVALPQLICSTFFNRSLPSNVVQRLNEQHNSREDRSDGGIVRSNSTSASESITKVFGKFWKRNELPNAEALASPSVESKPLILEPPFEKAEEIINTESKLTRIPSMPPQDINYASEGRAAFARSRHESLPVNVNISCATSEIYKKTLRLTSAQIESLGLERGVNEAIFSVTTAYQGTTRARCQIYLWKYSDRIVVSDIDGTITKSDVLGHVLPFVGTDWSQSGVAELFSQIQKNGYKMLYLSARAIGQAAITREYLKSIKQGDVFLPDGPLLLNPTSLLSAFHREVIEKKPEEFKISCLKDIQTLFPSNPFYAGYGNRLNDVWSYKAVDINVSRIFTINHKGELRHALTNSFQSSYTSLLELAEHIFPPLSGNNEGYERAEGYNSIEFWRDPLLFPCEKQNRDNQAREQTPPRKKT